MTESDLEAVRPYMSVSGGFPRNPRAKVLGRHATTSFDAVADSGALMHAVRGQEAPVQHEAWAFVLTSCERSRSREHRGMKQGTPLVAGPRLTALSLT